MDRLLFSAELSGQINDQPVSLTGEGTINDGHTDGTYLLKDMPKGFDSGILSVALITGYPNASASVNRAPNIFKGNSYNYRREITFNNGGRLDLYTECYLDNENSTLRSKFILNGNLPETGNLSNVEPIVESWRPNGEGKINGHFVASWKDDSNDQILVAHCNSFYQIKTKELSEGTLHRFIKIDSNVNKNMLRKVQDVLLFEDLFHSLESRQE